MDAATTTPTYTGRENSIDKIVKKLDNIENKLYEILNKDADSNSVSDQTHRHQNEENINNGIDCGFFIICDPSNVQQKKKIAEFWEEQRRISENIRDVYDSCEESKYILPGQNKQETNVQTTVPNIYEYILSSVVYEQSHSICSSLLNYPENMVKKFRSYKSFLFISSQSFFSRFSSDFSLFRSVSQ